MSDELRILILEDNPDDVELIEHELRGSGLKFISKPVQTREEYLKAFTEFVPDIILSDYDLPQFNGTEALKIAREICPEIPFILVTGAIGEDLAIEILTAGATDYVMKNRLTRLSPAVVRALAEAEEYRKRMKAEAERDLLLHALEIKVRERTAELRAEINERKRVQQQLDAHMSNSPLAIVEFDPDFRVIRWSPEAERLFGWSADEVIGKSIPEMNWVYENDVEETQQILSDMLYHRRSRIRHVNRNYCKGGSIIYCEWYNSAIYDENGRLASILSFVLNITERKRAEEAVLASTKKTETVLASITDMYVSYDNEWRFIDLNPLAEKLMGKARQELIGKVLWEVFPELKNSEIHEHYLKAVRTKSFESFEAYSPVTKHWHEFYLYPAEDGLSVYLRDITDRKRTEELIAEALLFNRTVLATSPVGIVTFHSSGRCVSANEAAVKMIGGSLEQLLTHDFRFLKSWKESGMLEAAQSALSTGQVMSLETHLRSSFGNDLWVHCRFAPFQHGGELHLLLLMSDMTERKRAGDLLRNEKLRLEIAQESAQAGTFEWDIQENKTIWSDQLKALYGFAPGEFKGFENWSSRVHPDDLRKSKKAIVEALKAGKYDDDFRVIWPDGSLHWLVARGRVVYNENGSPLLMTGINMDITKLKKTEEALKKSRDELEDRVRERTDDLSRIAEELRKSEEAYRLLVELNPVGVFRHIYDQVQKQCKRQHCNEAQLKLLGYPSLSEYLNDDPTNTMHMEEDWNHYISSLISEGKIVNFPVRMKRKDGKIIWVLLNAASRREGRQLFIEGAMTDISEQKRTEERLQVARKKLRAMASEIVIADERSRQHFAADLHDTVIQTIGAAKMRSQLIQHEIPEKVSNEYRQLQDFLSQSIIQARLIMAEMSPPVLNELGFIPALEWLTEQIQSQYGFKIEFNAIDRFTPLQHDIQVLLFQATRELLMNVVKHAGTDKAIVKVSANKQKVRIEVMDDGKGFDKRQAFRTDVSSGGFGLFSIRERIRHFGGHLIIQSEEGKGTRVIMTAPYTRGWAQAQAK